MLSLYCKVSTVAVEQLTLLFYILGYFWGSVFHLEAGCPIMFFVVFFSSFRQMVG
jgi:hypothetical protein